MVTIAANSDGTLKLDQVKWGFTTYFEINQYKYKKGVTIITNTIQSFGHLREAQAEFSRLTEVESAEV